MFGKIWQEPVELMADLGWTGPDVWFAHVIHLNKEEIKMLEGAGVAHCPSSNMKLSGGICPTTELLEAGVKLSIAVDGSASNDGSNMWEEVRRTYLLNHLKYGSNGLSAYQVLRMATRGGAEVLGRNDIGILQEGMAADIVLVDLNDIAYTGSHDPLVSLVTCGNSSLVKITIINGSIVAQDGEVLTINMHEMKEKAHKEATRLVTYQRRHV